jgi:hypothetical protein
MALDATRIRDDRGRFLGAPALAQDETRIQVGDIESAKFFDCDGFVVELAFFGGVVSAAIRPS